MTDLFIQVKTHQEQNLPFVLYSKPNKPFIVGLFQNNDHLYSVSNFEEKGFIFAPFNGQHYVIFPEEHLKIHTEDYQNEEIDLTENVFHEMTEKCKTDFEQLVKEGIAAINAGHFQKVVLSRKEEIPMTTFDVETVFKKMLSCYPSAFKYLFYHPKVGIWVGATPEQLLKVTDFDIETVALAGTKVNNKKENIVWKTKEQDEQHYVTQYILENIKSFVSEEVVSSPYTVEAGNLLHIKTDISAKLHAKSNLGEVLKVLHPTPAVCGYPKLIANDFILENEGYDREYYAGFLGELNMDFATGKSECSDLFVNLRCMKIKDKTAHLYVGCGITKDSDPESEFLETVSKSMIMRKILN